MTRPGSVATIPRYYLAARFSRSGEMSQYAERLRSAGNAVMSRWHESHFKAAEGESEDAFLRRCAVEDLEDIRESQIFVCFTETPPIGTGGRHVELGYAMAHRLDIILIGEKENVFHYLPGIAIHSLEQWQSMLAALPSNCPSCGVYSIPVAEGCKWTCPNCGFMGSCSY